jgi:hypothetical protein
LTILTLLAGTIAVPVRAGDWIVDTSVGCRVWNRIRNPTKRCGGPAPA